MSTLSVKSFNGISCLVPNAISVSTTEYYVSYNDYDRTIYGGVTTALVLGQMERFYILNGDHRKEYAKCSSLGECVAYFKANETQINKYSDR